MQYTDCPISQEGNQAITFGQLIEHNMRNVFVEKSYTKCGGETILRPFRTSTSVLYKKIKFSIKDFFSKCDQIRSFLRTWSHLLKKSFIFVCSALMEDVKILVLSSRDLFLHSMRWLFVPKSTIETLEKGVKYVRS